MLQKAGSDSTKFQASLAKYRMEFNAEAKPVWPKEGSCWKTLRHSDIAAWFDV